MTETKRWPFTPGTPICRNCWTQAIPIAQPHVAGPYGQPTEPVDDPGPNDRCAECHAHLRHCRNCMFRTPTGCLLRNAHRWPTTGLPGQDCPDFMWRDDDVAEGLDARDIAGNE